MRKYTLKVYFKDSPNPWVFENVTNICTEGGKERITQNHGGNIENQWFPLCNIFRIVEVYRTEERVSDIDELSSIDLTRRD